MTCIFVSRKGAKAQRVKDNYFLTIKDTNSQRNESAYIFNRNFVPFVFFVVQMFSSRLSSYS
jgi:hypothetical protein